MRLLARRLDGHRDAQRSVDEFTSFLIRHLEVRGDRGRERFPVNQQAGGSVRMAGFDDAKIADPTVTTVEYRFARVARHYDLSSVRDMTSAEALLHRMCGELEATGVTVLDISRDKIQIRDDRGTPAWIHVIRDVAGGADPTFQWLDPHF